MGPQTNNLTTNFNNNLPPDQLGFISSSSPSRPQIKKKTILLIVPAVILIILAIFLIIRQRNEAGSGSPEDLTKFVKIFQYGRPEDKKNVNLNLPANYSYAYQILDGSYSADERFSYGDQLYSAYRKYSGNKIGMENLFLYKVYVQLDTYREKLTEEFLKKDEAATEKLLKSYLDASQKNTLESIKEKLSITDKILNNQVAYLKELKNAGCIEGQSINYQCEVDAKYNSGDRFELSEIEEENIDLQSEIKSDYEPLTNSINNMLVGMYKAKIVKKETKK